MDSKIIEKDFSKTKNVSFREWKFQMFAEFKQTFDQNIFPRFSLFTKSASKTMYGTTYSTYSTYSKCMEM